MLKKKIKVLLASLVTISMVSITILCSNVYASSNKLPDKEVSANSIGDKKSTVGTLQSPADSSANEITETKLDGSPIMVQYLSEVSYFEQSKKSSQRKPLIALNVILNDCTNSRKSSQHMGFALFPFLLNLQEKND